MATLSQLRANIAAGGVVSAVSFGLFGLAIRFGFNHQLAPRSWTRPKAILKNTLRAPYGLRWISWSLLTSYADLLNGIPGTGTRGDGWAGPPLKVNLDGIIMIKYHTLMLKVSFLAAILCITIILPLNLTAKCDYETFGSGTCDPLVNMTDFEQTTIAHIPTLEYNETTKSDNDYVRDTFQHFWVDEISSRYLAIALVASVINWYACRLIWKEWIDNYALRRIYYLEHNHHEERLEELDVVGILPSKYETQTAMATNPRHPWLPHPELRDTVPNVPLFSCLYQLPSQIETADLPSSATDLERQLAAAVDFFDQCVPNQPGFSSSVAALSILPKATHVAAAWKKWYMCGRKLRKLRLIRQLILERLHEEHGMDEAMGEQDVEKGKSLEWNELATAKIGLERDEEQGEIALQAHSMDSFTCNQNESEIDPFTESLTNSRREQRPLLESMAEGDETSSEAAEEVGNSVSHASPAMEHPLDAQACSIRSDNVWENFGAPRFKYAEFDSKDFARRIGFREETELEQLVDGLGIEQLSVYAREYAQSSSGPCPFGIGDQFLRYSSLRRLEKLEKRALEAVKKANDDLVRVRESVNITSSGVVAETVVTAPYDPPNTKKMESPSVSAREDSDTPGRHPNLRQRTASIASRKWQEARALSGKIQKLHRNAMKTRVCSCCTGIWSSSKQAVSSRALYLKAKLPNLEERGEAFKTVINALEQPTYAVVTFTSRQAAVAARQCQTDGSGLDRWIPIEELPVAPLADAPPCELMYCRGCCRPVTLTISETEKTFRRCIGFTLFLALCFLYTIPLTLTSQVLNPKRLAASFPNWDALQSEDSFFFRALSGISSGVLYTLFFSSCPQLFKAIANFSGGVSSRRTAEEKALRYYWYFMLLTAFSGTSLAHMVWEGLVSGLNLGNEVKYVLVTVANSIPTEQAPVWMNWIIIRFTWTLPFSYLLQANTFAFTIINWPWCGRLMRGGGPGGPPPYRMYVDSGTAFMCVVAMAPACPLMAPIAFGYFVVVVLMLRWLLVFVYRPAYDSGGMKWPALHEMLISSILFGQILLTTILFLRAAFIPALLSAVPILPTYYFSQRCKEKFLGQYSDASLLQTSRLDGWDNSLPTSVEKREEYRRWLVDCHKASYVPVCLSGSESLLTVEPAVAVPIPRDDEENGRQSLMMTYVAQRASSTSQRGALFRRLEREGGRMNLSPSIDGSSRQETALF